MANTLKFGNGQWYGKSGSILAYNDENNNYKPLPFTFTRASSATRVNESGLIESVGSGIPRVDYLNNADGHLLLEPSRTNLLTYSEAFSNAEWVTATGSASFQGTGSEAALTADYGIAPDGTQTAFRVVLDLNGGTTTNDRSGFYDAITVVSGSTYTSSFFIKILDDNSIESVLSSLLGFLAAGGEATSSYEVFPNGWYRVKKTTTTTSTVGSYRFQIIGGGGIDSIDFLLWGAQLEAGSYSTSYIPTSGSSVTRVADDASQTPPSGVIGQTEGTLFLDIDPAQSGGYSSGFLTIGISDAAYNNAIGLASNSPSSEQLRGVVRSNGVTGYTGASFSTSISNKIAMSYTATTVKLFINGTLYASISKSAFSSPLTIVNIVTSSRVGLYEVKNYSLYDTALSDAELIALTS